jgi:hypothetical protein
MHLTGKSWHDAVRAMLDHAGQDRLVRAAEVAEAILAFCGEEARNRNGEIVLLDGNDGP